MDQKFHVLISFVRNVSLYHFFMQRLLEMVLFTVLLLVVLFQGGAYGSGEGVSSSTPGLYEPHLQ